MNNPNEIKFESMCERLIKQKENEREKYIKNVLTYGCASILGFFVFSLIFQNATFLSLSGIAIFLTLFFTCYNPYKEELLVLNAGITGESILRQKLRKILSSDYTVYYNYATPHGDIDAIVVGPLGIYVIEVKHYNGYVKVVGNKWERVKVGRGGTAYEAHVGNPEHQAKKNALYVKELLRQKGINMWIKYAVVMTNPEVKLQVENNTNVFYIDEIEKMFSKEKVLSTEQTDKIKSALNL